MSSPLSHFKLNRSTEIPLYQQIATFLRDQIATQGLSPGAKLPTDQELAIMLGISRGTATSALRMLAQEGLIERSPKLGTFVSSHVASPYVARHTPHTINIVRVISLLLPRTDDVLSIGILRGVQAACRSRNYNVLSAHAQENIYEQEHEIHRMIEAKVAGLIILPLASTTKDKGINILEANNGQSKTPFVLIDRYLPGFETNYVGSDHFGGSFVATEHLILLGHKTIAFVLDDSLMRSPTSIYERIEGYRAALRLHKLEPKDELIYEPDLSVVKSDLSRAYEPFFEVRGRATAAVAVNDSIAASLLQAAERLKVKVPLEFAVVGFDNSPFASQLTVPLTTVAQSFEEIGLKSAHLLIDQIEGKVSGTKRITLPMTLIIRNSCGARKNSLAFTV